MPVHVEQLNTRVTAQSSELPLSREQVEMLVRLVIERLEQKERGQREGRDETRLRSSILPRRPDT